MSMAVSTHSFAQLLQLKFMMGPRYSQAEMQHRRHSNDDPQQCIKSAGWRHHVMLCKLLQRRH